MKIGCIGTGYWGKNLARNFHEIGVLHTLYDTDPQTVEQFRRTYPNVRFASSYEEVLQSDIEAVSIASPADSHYRLAKEALLAGKDVLVEKPLSMKVSEGRELVELADKKNRILMVGHLLWYHPAVLKLKELISRGELGRIQYIYSNRLNLGKIRREENILWSFAPHDISVILGLLGEMPAAVQAQGGNYLHEKIADVTVSLLSFPSGVRAHIFVSWLHPFKDQRLVVVGDRKMAVFNDVEKKDKLCVFPHSISWKDNIPVANKADAEPIPLDLEEPLRAECLHFLDCVKTRNRPRTDGREGIRVLQVLEQCQQALLSQSGPAPSNEEAEQGYFVHASSVIDKGARIGRGTKIWHFSHVLAGSVIGKDCTIGQNASIGPDVRIGDRCKIQNNVSIYKGITLENEVFCGPSCVFTNVYNPRAFIDRKKEFMKTLVKRGATIGANSTIVCGTTIGTYSVIGAGAVVKSDVPDYAIVAGVPAKTIGWACHCGVTLHFSRKKAVCTGCGNQYRLEKNRILSLDGKALR